MNPRWNSIPNSHCNARKIFTANLLAKTYKSADLYEGFLLTFNISMKDVFPVNWRSVFLFLNVNVFMKTWHFKLILFICFYKCPIFLSVGFHSYLGEYNSHSGILSFLIINRILLIRFDMRFSDLSHTIMNYYPISRGLVFIFPRF